MSTLFDPPPDPDVRPDDDSGADRAEAHRTSVLHLVVGLVFLGLAGLWALSASGTVSSEDTWLLPGLLIVAGAAGLVAAFAGSRRGTR